MDLELNCKFKEGSTSTPKFREGTIYTPKLREVNLNEKQNIQYNYETQGVK